MSDTQIALNYLAPGVKVDFGYYHSLNNRGRTYRVKHGVVIRTVKHRKGTFYSQPMAVVQFERNRKPTTIEISRLQIAKGQS